MSTIFSKIISGDIPSHKIYEDDLTYAFLDIYPVQQGHTLVVPKTAVDRLEDLPPEEYQALMATVQRLMRHLRTALHVERMCLKVEGFDVPHAHVHLIPCNTAKEFYNRSDQSKAPDHEALAALAKELAW